MALMQPTMTQPKTATQLEEEARRRMAEQMQVQATVRPPSTAMAPKPAAPPPAPIAGAPKPTPIAIPPANPVQAAQDKLGTVGKGMPTAPVNPVEDFTKGGAGKGMAGPPAPATDDTFDAEVRRLLLERMRRGPDTAEAERLMRDELEQRMGADLVGQRARMGRAGFGSSGAMQALEGDTMRAARAELARGITGLRSAEDQRAFDNALASIGADTSKRESGTNAAITQAILAMLGMEGGAPAATGGGASPPAAIIDPIAAGLGAETKQPALPSSGGDAGMSSRTPIIVTAPPPGARLVNPSASFGGALYQGADGKYYGVRS